MKLPDPKKVVYTIGVISLKGKGFKKPTDDYMFTKSLWLEMWDKYREMPDEVTDGGNDKFFFPFNFRSIKFWAVANEVGGLTIMLPEEY